MRQNLKRFIPILFFLLVVFIVGIVILAWVMIRSKVKDQGSSPVFTNKMHSAYDTKQQKDWPSLWGGTQDSCLNKDQVKFSYSPIIVDDITFIEPMGELKPGHIMPGDHIGINYKTSPESKPIDVYAPADGIIAMIEHHPYKPPAGYPKDMRHYHFYITHSCTFFTGYVHLTDFTPEILAKSQELKQLYDENPAQPKNIWPKIQVQAGEKIGTTHSFGLFGMVTIDLNHINSGYLQPESYKSENWRMHAVSPWEYFKEPIKTEWYAKNPRTAQPRGGKIDFDIAGKLVGNWFEQNTGGFRDENAPVKQCGNWPCPYWDGHIAFVYDYIDPTQLRISIGHDWGLTIQTPYGVLGNGPDFKNIGVEDGLVKYELVVLKDISRERGYETEDPLIEISDESRPLSTILLQLTDEKSLKAEVFPRQSAPSVNAFTSNARIYGR